MSGAAEGGRDNPLKDEITLEVYYLEFFVQDFNFVISVSEEVEPSSALAHCL